MKKRDDEYFNDDEMQAMIKVFIRIFKFIVVACLASNIFR